MNVLRGKKSADWLSLWPEWDLSFGGVGEALFGRSFRLGDCSRTVCCHDYLKQICPDIKGIEAQHSWTSVLFVGLLTLVLHVLNYLLTARPSGGEHWYCSASLIPALEEVFIFRNLQIPVQRVAVFGYLEPLSAVIFSTILLGEHLGPLRLLACCIIGEQSLPKIYG